MTPQTAFDFPQPLSEKYRPQRVQDFIGLDKAKRIITNFASKPYQSAWLFVGASGTGKTTMGLALAAEMPAELHHIPAKECTLETVQDVCRKCHYSPRQPDTWQPVRFHLVLIDEADQMSNAAQLALLSKLDATAFPPATIFIFTCNATNNLEPITGLLSAIWDRETDNPLERPNFQRIVKDSCNNVRDALMTLETEILAA